MSIKDQIARLPDTYAKTPDSLVYKLLSLDSEEFDEFRTAIVRIEDWLSFENAEGTTLDLIGQNLGVFRGNMDDTRYRRRIWLKLANIISSGEIDKLNDILFVFMGDSFEKVQEGWTNVPVWKYFFNGELHFNSTEYLFDAGNPFPQGPPEPATIIVYYDPDVLFEKISSEFRESGTSYQANDILESITDLFSVASDSAAGGVRVVWHPKLRTVHDAISVLQDTRLVIIIGTTRSILFDGSYDFDGSIVFDGGSTALWVNHEETFKLTHQVLSAPEHRFEGLARFNGREVFDSSRELVVHDPRTNIQVPGETVIPVEQSAASITVLGPTMPRFVGELEFDGTIRFDGYTALWASYEQTLEVNHHIEGKPLSRFDTNIYFNGSMNFDGARDFIMNNMVLKVLT